MQYQQVSVNEDQTEDITRLETLHSQATSQDALSRHDNGARGGEDQEESQSEDRGQPPPTLDAMDTDPVSMAFIDQMSNNELDAANVMTAHQNAPRTQAFDLTVPNHQTIDGGQMHIDDADQDNDDEISDSDNDGDSDDDQGDALDPNDPTAHFIIVNRADANHESTVCPACDSVVQDNELVYLTCGHVWCSDCLNNNLRAALSNRTMFPPRCCNATPDGINMNAVESYLEDDVLFRYLNVGEEYASPDPTFCCDPKCGIFIKVPANNISQWASCAKCHKSTCIQCKGAYLDHPTADDHPELISKEDKELAEREGYKQCPNPKCRNLLERIDGCDHMTCDCGTNFCYRCGRSLDYDSVGGMACNCQGQNPWVDGVQQWQNGGDSDHEDGENDEDEEDEIVDEMQVIPVDPPRPELPPATPTDRLDVLLEHSAIVNADFLRFPMPRIPMRRDAEEVFDSLHPGIQELWDKLEAWKKEDDDVIRDLERRLDIISASTTKASDKIRQLEDVDSDDFRKLKDAVNDEFRKRQDEAKDEFRKLERPLGKVYAPVPEAEQKQDQHRAHDIEDDGAQDTAEAGSHDAW